MAVAAAAAIDAEPYNPNPLLVIDKHSNDKLTRFKTDEVTNKQFQTISIKFCLA